MEEYIAHGFEELPLQIEFQERLRKQVEVGRKKLDEAISRAADIPVPGRLVQPTEQERLEEIREVLKKGEISRSEAKKDDVFKVRLFETPTIILFQLAPTGYAEGTEQAENIISKNKEYEKGKTKSPDGRFKDTFTQCMPPHFYNEEIETEPIVKEDKGCIASEWRLYDAYNNKEEAKIVKNCTDNDGSSISDENEQECISLENHNKFKQALMFTCRVLASNTFAKEQVTFCKKHLPSRQMTYNMNLLWTLAGMDAGPVNKICINPKNSKVFAICYGDREGKGRVMVWQAKNPEGPERDAVIDRAVTNLEFSLSQPKLLAAVTREGSVHLIDIAIQPPLVSHVNSEEQPPYTEPLWSLAWYSYNDGVSESERLLTIGQSGQLWMWDPITQKGNKKMAELSFIASPDPEITVRSQKILGSSLEEEFPYDDIDSDQLFLEVPYVGLDLSLSPKDRSELYVTTDIGCIIKVNTRKAGGAWTRQSGHSLAVFGLRHSPYIPSVFLTHSADGDVCVWIHGYDKPILTLSISDINLFGIDCAVWSPSHSSILASLSRERVCLWDISRQVDLPMTSITGRHYTTIAFSHNGTSLLVGCKEGDVMVYRLSEMPHRPYMQKEHLEKALRKAVEGKRELVKAIDKYL